MTLIPESPGFCGLGDTASPGSGSFSLIFRSSGSCGKSSECSVGGDEIVAASWAWSTPFTGCILLLLSDRNLLVLQRQIELNCARLRRLFNALSDRFGRFATDRVFEFQPGRLINPLQLVSLFANLLNSSPRQTEVADTRTEQSDHPEARSLFFPADRDQGQAVIGRINRLRIGRVPASDFEVERTRYDRLENPIADELRYQQVKAQRFRLETQASSLLQVRSTDRALS